jgi:sulfatase maturation enzyme AslB (radical SAM superfamily)
MGKIMDSAKTQLSCEWQDGGLAFSYNSLHVCCIPSPGGGWERIAGYSGGVLPLDDIARVRMNSIAKNNSEGNPVCRGCRWLKERPQSRNGYLVDWINFSHFFGCNLKCTYCYIQRKDFKHPTKPPYEVLTALKEMVHRDQLSPNAIILWGGGEPVILKDFDKIFAFLSNHGCDQTVNTNGTIFSEAICEALARNNRVKLQCSFDAGDPETYLRIKGADLFDRVCENLSRYVSAAPELSNAKIIFVEANSGEHEVMAFVDTCRRIGFQRIVVDVDQFSEHPERFLDSMAMVLYLAEQAGIRAEVESCGSNRFPDIKGRVDEYLRRRAS